MAKRKSLGPPSDAEMLARIAEVGEEAKTATEKYEKARKKCRELKGVADDANARLAKLSLQTREPALFDQPETPTEDEDSDDSEE